MKQYQLGIRPCCRKAGPRECTRHGGGRWDHHPRRRRATGLAPTLGSLAYSRRGPGARTLAPASANASTPRRQDRHIDLRRRASHLGSPSPACRMRTANAFQRAQWSENTEYRLSARAEQFSGPGRRAMYQLANRIEPEELQNPWRRNCSWKMLKAGYTSVAGIPLSAPPEERRSVSRQRNGPVGRPSTNAAEIAGNWPHLSADAVPDQ